MPDECSIATVKLTEWSPGLRAATDCRTRRSSEILQYVESAFRSVRRSTLKLLALTVASTLQYAQLGRNPPADGQPIRHSGNSALPGAATAARLGRRKVIGMSTSGRRRRALG